MSDLRPENTVLVIENSRSLWRRDLGPPRYHILFRAIQSFIEKKATVDPMDKVSIVFMYPSPCLVHPLEKASDLLKYSLPLLLCVSNGKKSISPSSSLLFSKRKSSYKEALQYAMDILIERIRKIGEEVNRIIFLTDNYNIILSHAPLPLIEKAEALNIFIDVALLQHVRHPVPREIFLLFTTPTRGEFGVFYNKKAFLRGMEGFASKKNIDDVLGEPKDKENVDDEKARFWAEIALDLVYPFLSEECSDNLDDMVKNSQREMLLSHNSNETTCRICFSSHSPLSHHYFSKTGVYCPQCGLPMHLYCAAAWARETPPSPYVFRCPYCYTLLRVSPILSKGLVFLSNKEKHINNDEDYHSSFVEMVRVPSDKVRELSSSISSSFCFYCFHPLGSCSHTKGETPENGEKIFKCSRCGALYHEKCLLPMYKEEQSCKNCGGKIR